MSKLFPSLQTDFYIKCAVMVGHIGTYIRGVSDRVERKKEVMKTSFHSTIHHYWTVVLPVHLGHMAHDPMYLFPAGLVDSPEAPWLCLCANVHVCVDFFFFWHVCVKDQI